MKRISYLKNSIDLNGEKFLEMVEAVAWAGRDTWPMHKVEKAISQVSTHYTAWCDQEIVGLVRVLSDDLVFTCLPEILIKPDYQSQGIGTHLMKMVIEDYGATIIFLGAQSGNETFFEKLEFKKGPQSYERCFRPPK